MESLPVHNSGYCVWRGPYSMNAKDPVVDFKKRVGKLYALQKAKKKNHRYQCLPTFPMAVNSCCPGWHIDKKKSWIGKWCYTNSI